LAAAAIGGAIALAPIASADTNPLVPYGTDPHSPYVLGYHVSNHDEANTRNGHSVRIFSRTQREVGGRIRTLRIEQVRPKNGWRSPALRAEPHQCRALAAWPALRAVFDIAKTPEVPDRRLLVDGCGHVHDCFDRGHNLAAVTGNCSDLP
jgi:hypothetical protein